MPLYSSPLLTTIKSESSLNLAKKTDLLFLVLATLESKDRLCGKADPYSYLLPSCCRNLRPLLAKALLWSSDFFFWWGEGMPSVTHFPLLLGHQYFPLNRGIWVRGSLSPPGLSTRELVLSQALPWWEDCSIFGQDKSRYVSVQRGSLFGVGAPQEETSQLKCSYPSGGWEEDKEPCCSKRSRNQKD